jgi:MoxR-like ATPase
MQTVPMPSVAARQGTSPGQPPNGQIPNGQIPNGQMPHGQMPVSGVPAGNPYTQAAVWPGQQ